MDVDGVGSSSSGRRGERDKCSPGKLCGFQWTGPNCASFHFRHVDDGESETDQKGIRNAKKGGGDCGGRCSHGAVDMDTSPAKVCGFLQPTFLFIYFFCLQIYGIRFLRMTFLS
jgi:hypothetical protein